MTIEARPIDKVLAVAANVRQVADDNWLCNCPVHEADGQAHEPSLDIKVKSDGTLLLKCRACEATTVQIVHAFGLTMSDLFPEHSRKYTGEKHGSKKQKGRKVKEYEYQDAQGCKAFRVERWEWTDGNGVTHKTFSQSRPNGSGGFVPGLRGVERVPYKLPELIAAPKEQVVWIVEGERKVEALMKWGQVATCNAGGAGKWNKDFSTRFLKDRIVVILPDNDPVDPETGRCPGRDHARKVLEFTKPVAKSVRILEIPGLPPKGDIVDWIDAGGTLPQLLELLNTPIVEQPESASQASPEIQQMDPLDLRVPESRTDIGQGRRVIRDHGQSLRYCFAWDKWLIWDNTRWRADDIGNAMHRAKESASSLWEEMRDIGRDVSEDTLMKIVAFVKNASGMRAVEKSLMAAACEPGVAVKPGELDSNPWLLNCLNGTVDLQTGILQPHQQSDLITKIAPTKFDPDATCPHWEQFLLSIFDTEEMVSYIQRLAGYWSTGVIREQSLPILWGVGSNGKTTFLNAIMDVLGGDYTMKAPADFLMAKRNDAHPTDKADLFGRRFVACSETEDGKRLAESMVKEITGDEPIRARRMREDFWQFNPTHKIALVTNHLPQIRGTDQGIWRRIRRISFHKQFWNPDMDEEGPPELRQDKSIKEKLESERSGILTWIIRGAIAWNQDGEQAPASVSDWTKEYRASQDVLGAFLEDMCEIDANCVVKASDIYRAYRRWTEANGEFTINQRQFGQVMNERGFVRYTNNGKWYRGLRVVLSEDGNGSF